MARKKIVPTSKDWYENVVQENGFTTQWMGVGIVKHPNDLHIYQEIIWATKPDVIIETGAYAGGSALYLAHVLDALAEQTGHQGKIVSLELMNRPEIVFPTHNRLEFRVGLSSTDPKNVSYCKKLRGRKMVILDSHHSKAHVLDEMNKYAPIVSPGCYMIVEDTNPDGYFLGGGYDGQG